MQIGAQQKAIRRMVGARPLVRNNVGSLQRSLNSTACHGAAAIGFQKLPTKNRLSPPNCYLTSNSFSAVFNHCRIKRWRDISAHRIQWSSFLKLGVGNQIYHRPSGCGRNWN